jgi:hypothetical protein
MVEDHARSPAPRGKPCAIRCPAAYTVPRRGRRVRCSWLRSRSPAPFLSHTHPSLGGSRSYLSPSRRFILVEVAKRIGDLYSDPPAHRRPPATRPHQRIPESLTRPWGHRGRSTSDASLGWNGAGGRKTANSFAANVRPRFAPSLRRCMTGACARPGFGMTARCAIC